MIDVDDIDPRRVANVALIVVAVAMALLAASIVYAFTRQTDWRPLGPFPEQQVISDNTYEWDDPGNAVLSIPSVPLDGGVVTVEGTKCYKEQVTVQGTKFWSSKAPPGGTWEDAPGTATRDSGCHTGTFVNLIPPEIADFTAVAGGVIVVTISGCETPLSDTRGEGVRLCWTTEPFALTP